HPWVMHEWLADLAMYLLYLAGGLPWWVAVFAGIVTAAAVQRLPTHRHQVHHFVDREAEDLLPPADLEEHGSPGTPPPAVGGGLGLPQRPPPFHHGDEGTPHVDDPRDHGRRSGNPGRLEPRHDLADSLRLGGAHEAAHPEQQQSDDSRVTHPKRRSQDTARGCVEQANSDRRPLPAALERDRRAIR